MKKGNFQRILLRSGLVLNIFFAGMLLLVYLSSIIPPDKFWPAAFLALAYPFFLVVNLLFAAWYIFRKSRYAFISSTAILLGYKSLLGFVQPIPHWNDDEGGLKVVTYNVHFFFGDTQNKKGGLKTFEWLRSVNADIICLQESSLAKSGPYSPEAMKNSLPGIRYYQLAHTVSGGGMFTLSKYPIVQLGEIRFEHSSNMVLFSDIVYRKGDTIRVYNCHFQSYRITPEDYSLTDPDKSGTNEQQMREARQISKKMILAFSFRAKQARKVAAHISKCKYPVILCGDFNDTSTSYTSYTIRNQNDLADSFTEAGFGFSSTYNGFLPAFRIDYILHSQSFSTNSYQRSSYGYSDHFPVIATFGRLK